MNDPERLGDYVLEEFLGRGPNGAVYRGRRADDLLVAVKALEPQFAGPIGPPDALRASFAAATIRLSRLRHPNLIQILQATDNGETAFAATEFAPGGNLLGRFEGLTAGDVSVIAGLVTALAGALDALHAEGLTHGGVKPSNVVFTAEGVPKLTDAGLGQITGYHQVVDIVSGAEPRHLAPEQVRDGDIGPGYDQFHLATLAYELLTGERPFAGKRRQAELHRLMNEEPTGPHFLDPALPEEVDAVVLRALSKLPDDRFDSCGAMASALCGALNVSLEPPQTDSAASPAAPAAKDKPPPAKGTPTEKEAAGAEAAAVEEAAAAQPDSAEAAAEPVVIEDTLIEEPAKEPAPESTDESPEEPAEQVVLAATEPPPADEPATKPVAKPADDVPADKAAVAPVVGDAGGSGSTPQTGETTISDEHRFASTPDDTRQHDLTPDPDATEMQVVAEDPDATMMQPIEFDPDATVLHGNIADPDATVFRPESDDLDATIADNTASGRNDPVVIVYGPGARRSGTRTDPMVDFGGGDRMTAGGGASAAAPRQASSGLWLTLFFLIAVFAAGGAVVLGDFDLPGWLTGSSTPAEEPATPPDAAPVDRTIGPWTVEVRSAAPGAEIWINDRSAGLRTPAAVTLRGEPGRPVRMELRRGAVVLGTAEWTLGPDVPTQWNPEDGP